MTILSGGGGQPKTSLLRAFGTNGFTLAEVLITISIFGIVAAITLPALIQRNNNKVTEARLKKFYSVINQAIILSELENGDRKDWYRDYSGAVIDPDGKPIEGTSEAEKWFMQYIGKYLKIVGKETTDRGMFIVYFEDGSALMQLNHGTTRDWVFYPQKVKRCVERYGYPTSITSGGLGVCAFAFGFVPGKPGQTQTEAEATGFGFLYNKGFESYTYAWDGSREFLIEHCKDNSTKGVYCTMLIQLNNWQIPKDYPHKVSY